mmetsp:Transcript_25584/g.35190  ORF Transcript_25584/g.35190 Transcript_25584/m.35190 type:complete len:301 (-) Transcript_25584:147-1049(-)|eukprot:CAMPEP_0170072990 /NCGR_PEP_ID=MMETSP0019_2-20121128/10490_1 /TAXON_ID=98059 /ORGANISM="Dinobryon sp., Strain UTEXLB2267" /LENGTH=300 /DNA_ID=CAMNT_0010282237 /DNA_START=591 /DNA_END=1493 /DNA_ORIENTATION=-
MSNVLKEKNLRNAAERGDIRTIRTLLDEGTDINAADDVGRTPLLLAAYYGRTEMALLLLAGGARADATNSSGRTSLHLVAWNGHLEVATLLLDRGADKDAVDQGGDAPLHDAASRGHIQVASILLARGARTDAVNQRGKTPSQLARERGHTDMAELLDRATEGIARPQQQTQVALSQHTTGIAPDTFLVSNINYTVSAPELADPSQCTFLALEDSVSVSSLNVPNHFMCPLTQEIMTDPVITTNGLTYERAYIEEWFRHHATDPLTNTVVANVLIPNRALKEAIEEFKSQHTESGIIVRK